MRRRKAADRRRRARRPGPGIAPLPARNVALLRQVTPYDLVESARLPDGVLRPLVERMQKPEEMHIDWRYT
jgi:hypothetical protein